MRAPDSATFATPPRRASPAGFWRSLRSRWAFARHGLPYTSAIIERLYEIYLNHHKVIHFRDGRPVYSLMTPAAFSEPAANFVARTMFRTIQNKNTPNLMSFAVNDVCNATCGFCSFFEGVDDPSRTVMDLDQCRRLVGDAQDLGVSVINIVGGEPLMRPDLADIVASVDKTRATTVLFTNGWLLEQKAEGLRRAGLDSVYVSLDSADAAEHDELRGVPGLMERAIAGVRKAEALGMSTGISCTLSPKSYASGVLDDVVELGRRIGVHEVLFFDTLPTGRCKARVDLVNDRSWVDGIVAKARDYALRPDYPGVIAHAYMTSHMSVGCACGTSYFYASPYGDIMSCDFNHAVFGNVLERPLYEIWDAMTSTPGFSSAKWGGCKIKDPASLAAPMVSPGRHPARESEEA